MEPREKAFERYETERPFFNYVPIRMSNGFLVTEINGCCAKCREQVEAEHFRGVVSELFSEGDDGPSVVSFDGHGICFKCNLMSPIFGRFRTHKKSVQLEWMKEGRWVRAGMIRDAWWGRLFDKINGLFSS